MTAHSVLNVHAALEWGNSELYKYYERNGLGYGTVHNFGRTIKILVDNGTEFKNKLFKEVVEKLGTEFSIHSPPYRPQSNGKIEGFHRFLKTCIGKHINYGLEWNELTPMATAFKES